MVNGIVPLNEVTLNSNCQWSKAGDVQILSPIIPLSGTHNAEDLPHTYVGMVCMCMMYVLYMMYVYDGMYFQMYL